MTRKQHQRHQATQFLQLQHTAVSSLSFLLRTIHVESHDEETGVPVDAGRSPPSPGPAAARRESTPCNMRQQPAEDTVHSLHGELAEVEKGDPAAPVSRDVTAFHDEESCFFMPELAVLSAGGAQPIRIDNSTSPPNGTDR
ncbi:hypothetical protein [Burkholderia cepacia]|uniref:hypothetical protein n=1 Tax=Burkholderia cepacia TaxID=292 RepID=UPI00398EAB97